MILLWVRKEIVGLHLHGSENNPADPAATPGYQDVVLNIAARLDEYHDFEREVFYDYVYWQHAIYDYYTGEKFPRMNNDGDTENKFSKTITFDGKEYQVNYSETTEWHGFFEEDDDGNLSRYQICNAVWTFTVPSGYDGLVFKLAECKEPSAEMDTGELDTSVSYAENDGSQFFRFGTTPVEDQPKDGLDIHFWGGQDLDTGVSFNYNLTNSTGQAVNGCYALLSYAPRLVKSDYADAPYLSAELHSFDLTLQPGETATGTVESSMGKVTEGLKTVWIQFDSQSERDEFLSSSVLYEDYGRYNVQTDGGVQWLKDNFGITIAPAL